MCIYYIHVYTFTIDSQLTTLKNALLINIPRVDTLNTPRRSYYCSQVCSDDSHIDSCPLFIGWVAQHNPSQYKTQSFPTCTRGT